MFVVLVQPPTGERVTSITPPVGLAYLAAILEQLNIKLACIAADAEGLNATQTADKIIGLRPDVIGLSITTIAVNNSLRIAQRVKGALKNVVTIAGGPHPSVLPEELLLAGYDFIVRGEGEQTLKEVMKFLLNGGSREDIAGISYMINGRIIHNKSRPLITDLNSLSFPAWHFFPIESYRSEFKKTNRSLPILTSRGCPGRCTFCYKGLFGNRFRVRTPENIIAEIKYLKNKYHIDEFDILDDNFTSIVSRAIDVCKLLIADKINLPWSLPSGIRVDTVTEELMEAIRDAGCYRVGFGMESGNERILKSIKKGVTKDQMRTAVHLAKMKGLVTGCYFMIGNLEETEETIDDTINFALELDPDIAQFAIATPFPGTEMYDILKKKNMILSNNWDDYNYFVSGRKVFIHEQLNPEIISKKYNKAYLSFYLRPSYIMKRLKSISNRRELLKLIKAGIRFVKMLKQNINL